MSTTHNECASPMDTRIPKFNIVAQYSDGVIVVWPCVAYWIGIRWSWCRYNLMWECLVQVAFCLLVEERKRSEVESSCSLYTTTPSPEAREWDAAKVKWLWSNWELSERELAQGSILYKKMLNHSRGHRSNGLFSMFVKLLVRFKIQDSNQCLFASNHGHPNACLQAGPVNIRPGWAAYLVELNWALVLELMCCLDWQGYHLELMKWEFGQWGENLPWLGIYANLY